MRLIRVTVAALTAASALALTACDPDAAAGGSAAPAPSSPAATGSAPAAGSNSPKPSASSGKSAEAGGKPSKPAADCTANAAQVGTVVEATENGYLTHIWFRARPTRFVCGPDVPNDGYFEAVGEPKVYDVGNSTKTLLLDENLKAKEVDVFVFMKAQEACIQHKQPAAPYRCFGNQYAVKLDSKGALLSVTQLYRP
ncbi:hypothetical protein ACFV1L_31710 [Kitasatospora sp. NPDC059646]|uniref:hypothetical protein n=1 Tax=Kitasatospora sp. NPDC059646 TaxID=3346893 RepID=UPI003694C5C0